MELFLQIVGGVFTAVVLSVVVLAAVLYFFIRFKFRGVLREFAKALESVAHGAVPPFRLHLDPVDRTDLDDEELEEFHAACASVVDLDFEDAGTFEDPEAGILVRGFLSEPDQTWVAVYRHFSGLIFADVVRKYQDGSRWSFASSEDSGLASPPDKIVRFLPGQDVTALIAEFRAEAPRDNIQVFPLADFQRFLESEYASDMNWQAERGGPDDEEIRDMTRRALPRDGGDVSEQQLDEISENLRNAWKDAIGTFFSERAMRRYHRERNHSSREQGLIEYRLLAVHDRLSPRNLVEMVHGWCPTLDEEEDDDDDPELLQIQADLATCTGLIESGVPGREVFRRLVQNNEERLGGFELDYEVARPVAAEIWLRPEEDDDDDDRYDDDEL